MSTFSRYLIIATIAGILFVPFLGRTNLFDWDEINFAESAREMIVTGNYGVVQIDFKPFWEKPPFFIWMQVASMKLFGINAFAARLPNAITGILTLLVLYSCGRRLGGEPCGLLWVMAYAGSWLPFFYFKSGIIDPTFNLLIFSAIWKAYRIPHTPRPYRKAVWSGIFLGLAVITKGPVAILICGLVLLAYLIWKKGQAALRPVHLGIIALVGMAIICGWFGYIAAVSGWGLIGEFIRYQIRLFSTPDSTHGGPFFYHWYVLLIGCFPASVFLLAWIRRVPVVQQQGGQQKDFRGLMWILFWVVLILFSIVKTKIVHYSSLCYFPLTFLAACRLESLLKASSHRKKGLILLLATLGILIGLSLLALPLAGMHPAWLAAHIADPFARANLQAPVHWSYADCLPGLIYILGILLCIGWWYRQKTRRSLITLLVTQLAIMELVVVLFTPKIEAYSQQAAIRFYESLQGKDVYVHVLGFKSYAQLFYTRAMPQSNPRHDQEDWLLNGNLDKPAYFVCKITSEAHFKANPKLEVIGMKNGFVFLKRKP